MFYEERNIIITLFLTTFFHNIKKNKRARESKYKSNNVWENRNILKNEINIIYFIHILWSSFVCIVLKFKLHHSKPNGIFMCCKGYLSLHFKISKQCITSP